MIIPTPHIMETTIDPAVKAPQERAIHQIDLPFDVLGHASLSVENNLT